MKKACVRKVGMKLFSTGLRELSVEEQMDEGGGTVMSWCGESVPPTEDCPIFVDVDGALDDGFWSGSGTNRPPPCPDCLLAISNAAMAKARDAERQAG